MTHQQLGVILILLALNFGVWAVIAVKRAFTDYDVNVRRALKFAVTCVIACGLLATGAALLI